MGGNGPGATGGGPAAGEGLAVGATVGFCPDCSRARRSASCFSFLLLRMEETTLMMMKIISHE
jgi:hypothetical protein